jgi:hypothetical protein
LSVKYYVYRHIRLDKNEPFYIGIGTKPNDYNNWSEEYGRACNRTERHAAWLSIVEKTDYRIEIIFESNDRDEIKNKEKEFIDLYQSKLFDGGTLVNIGSSDFNKIEKDVLWGKVDIKIRKRKITIKSKGKSATKIEQFDYKGNLLNTFLDIQEASKILNRSVISIRDHLKGKTKTCGWTILKPVFEN